MFVLLLGGAASAKGTDAQFPIVFESMRDGNSEIYLMAGDGTNQTRLTNNGFQDSVPSLTPYGVAYASNRNGTWDIVFQPLIQDAKRGPVAITTTAQADFAPAISPDGTQVAFERRQQPGHTELFVTDGTSERQLTHLGGENFALTWAPDSKRVAFVHGRGRAYHVVVASLDGRVDIDLSRASGHNADFDPAWSPRGDEVAISRQDRKGNYDIWAVRIDGRGERRLTSARAEESSPTWAPDASAIAYVRGADGAYEIFMMNPDGSDQRNITNSPGAADVAPDWGVPVSAFQQPHSFGRLLRNAAASNAAAASGFFCTKIGTARADLLVGSNGGDVICGVGGRDTIIARRGADVLAGGFGNDRFYGGPGADMIFARAGFGREKDRVSGGRGRSDMAWVDRRDDLVMRDTEALRPP